VQFDAPPTANMPCEQFVHAVALVAPVTFEYVPAGQLVHDVVPNWPGGHSEVCSRDRPDKFFVQLSIETDPASEDDGAGHCTHAPPFGP
jgi:hypothetical protein